MYKKISLLNLLFFLLISAPTLASSSDRECLKCHATSSGGKISQAGKSIALTPDTEILIRSVHNQLSCTDCHKHYSSFPHGEKVERVTCMNCHQAEGAEYQKSVHGRGFVSGSTDVPSCTRCHGKHDIRKPADPLSRVYRMNLIKVCIQCHTDEKLEKMHQLPETTFIKAYEKSVHGQALEKGKLAVAAACNDCHGAHDIKPADDPKSIRQKVNIPHLCAKCHPGTHEVYRESIHGKALAQGMKDAPVCTDCHGEHMIAKSLSPESKVSVKNIPATCSRCHADKAIVEKYGLATRRFTTYLKSYHGVYNKYGVTVVAECASCHGYHDIRPSSDPKSSINKANLARTCGKCHPGASENFARGTIHIEPTKESSAPVYYVRKFYIWFIGILIFCFIAYATLDLIGKVHKR